MLYLITLPPPLQPGIYRVHEISSERAGQMIQAAHRTGQLLSRVTFPATADVLRTLSHVPLSVPPKAPPQPSLRSGDALIQAKLREHVVKPPADYPLSVGDLEFLLIEYADR